MKKYKITLTENQMYLLKDICELRFRIDLCQESELAEILATMNNLDLSPQNPHHKEIFDRYIDRREDLSAVIRCLYEIACPWSIRGTSRRERDKDALNAETIWGSIRYQLWSDREDRDSLEYVVDSNKPMQLGSEPIPEIEVVEE
jgi:hypothetical protein